MRRRALLAASAASGGGKIVNYLRIKETNFTQVIVSFDYPPTSLIVLTVTMNGMIGVETIESIYFMGATELRLALGPGNSLVSIEIDSPTEDDTYIYKVEL